MLEIVLNIQVITSTNLLSIFRRDKKKTLNNYSKYKYLKTIFFFKKLLVYKE